MRMSQVKLNQLLNMNDGVFHYIYLQGKCDWLTDEMASLLDIEYIINHSGNKWASPLARNTLPDDIIRVAQIITLHFADNWNRIYNAYFNTEYKPLENYSMTEIETPDITHTTDTNVNTDVTTTTKGKNDTYGFNSYNAVGDSESSAESHNQGLFKDNYSKETSTETGTRQVTRSGNIGVTTSQQMLESELSLRKYKFYDTIMTDIDSILALQIY